MRILHVVRQFTPAIGGLESYVGNLARHQAALGHVCEVLTLNKTFHGAGGALPAQDFMGDVSIRRIPFVGYQRFFIPLVSPSYFKGFDVIHVHNTDVFFDLIALFKFFIARPIFATTHGGFFHTDKFKAIKKLYFTFITRTALLQYDKVFAISQHDYNRFAPYAKDCILLPNAVEPLAQGLSQGQDFLYLGRLAAHKNIHLIIETFARLKTQHGVDGMLHIVGPEWDVKISELAARAQSRGIGDQVIFHGGLDHQEMGRIAMRCGFFLSASTYEGFGMSMVEAMTLGIIPLVEPNASFQELLGQAGVGRCVRYAMPDQAATLIANALKTITQEDRRRAQSFAARFSWGALTKACLDAYANALD